MHSEKQTKEMTKPESEYVDCKLVKLKSILKSREVKSSTSPKLECVLESPTKPVKMGKSEPLSLAKCVKISPRPEYVSPYKMSVLQQDTQSKSTSSNAASPRTTMKTIRNKNGKKHAKKSSSKKALKSKAIENEFQEKLHGIHTRICAQIIEVKRGLFEPIAEPDGKEDMMRRKKCEHEFWCRFTRNFISELVRQMRIFFRLAQSKPRTLSCTKLVQRRLLTLHQIALQSLMSYQGHMPMSLSNDLNSNVKFILEQMLSVLKLCIEHKICTNVVKIQHAINSLLKFQEEDKKTMKANFKEMKPLSSSPRRTEQQKLAKRLSMYLDRPGQFKLLSRSLRKCLRPKNYKKNSSKLNSIQEPTGPIVLDPDVDTLISLQETCSDETDDDMRLQKALFNMGNLISNAIDYKNKLKTMMSSYPDFFETGEKPFGLVSVLATQLINEAIIDMTTWDNEHVMNEFAPRT